MRKILGNIRSISIVFPSPFVSAIEPPETRRNVSSYKLYHKADNPGHLLYENVCGRLAPSSVISRHRLRTFVESS